MIARHVSICAACHGEGALSQPPFDPKHPDRRLRWRSKDACDGCDGNGYVPASGPDIAAHALDVYMQPERWGVDR